MKGQLRVFISSTAVDLKDYRAKVLHSILSVGLIPEDMIDWPASDDDATAASIERVAKSDVLLLIIAHRYGHVPEKAEVGITELEYRAALERGIPILPFIVDPSYPWNIGFVDWENAPKLTRFKSDVLKRHVAASFTSPDSLARLVVQSLVSFGESRQIQRCFPDSIRKIVVRNVGDLATIPDVAVPIGSAEDGLPLVVQVERSKELMVLFADSDLRRPDLTKEFPDAVVDELKRALSEPNRLRSVTCRDDRRVDMYVSRKNLGEMFDSAFALLVRIARHSVPHESQDAMPLKPVLPARRPHRGFRPHPHHADSFPMLGNLESYGGVNRFLGVALDGSGLYCVGRRQDQWVEWRPFMHETLCATFPDEEFTIHGLTKFKGKLSEYPEAIQHYALENMTAQGYLSNRVELRIRRHAVCSLVLSIAEALCSYHRSQNRVHADLKPANVLLLQNGPHLIDGFAVPVGELSPGCTPGWSAPEQILGQPVSYHTDTYSLAAMALAILGGDLIGELTTYRVPPVGGSSRIEVLRNPVPHLQSNSSILSHEARDQWFELLRSCFRFDPAERMDCETFTSGLSKLLSQHSVGGTLSIELPSTIVAAISADGRHQAVRLIRDDMIPLEDPVSPSDVGNAYDEFEDETNEPMPPPRANLPHRSLRPPPPPEPSRPAPFAR